MNTEVLSKWAAENNVLTRVEATPGRTAGNPSGEAAENAVIGCALNEPALIPEIAQRADESWFSSSTARDAYVVILALYNAGKFPGGDTCRERLCADGGAMIPPAYIAECVAAGAANANVHAHLDVLESLVIERRSGLTPIKPDFDEYRSAQVFLARAGGIKCVGTTWHQYASGAWSPIPRDEFRPVAQLVLPPLIRTGRRETSILAHAEGARQVPADSLRGFYYLDENGAVVVNTGNCVLRITAKGCVPEPHSPDHRFTLKTAANYDPGAAAPVFLKTLREVLPDPKDQHLFYLVIGSMLLPDCRFEAAMIGYGPAGSGKSTIFEAAVNALGGQLVSRMTMRQICDPKGYYVPKLRHAAVNLGTELESLEVEDGGIFKALCSGESIQAREIYGEPFPLKNTAKLIFLSNDLPRFKNGSDGELRRMRFLRFDTTPALPDVTLKSKLAVERDGILLLMIYQLRILLRLTHLPCGGAQSSSTLNRFEVTHDPIRTFVARKCQLASDFAEEKSKLQQAYNEFCDEFGLPPTPGNQFWRKLYDRFTSVRATRKRVTGSDGSFNNLVSGIKLNCSEVE